MGSQGGSWMTVPHIPSMSTRDRQTDARKRESPMAGSSQRSGKLALSQIPPPYGCTAVRF